MTNTCVCGCGRTLLDGYAAVECTEHARRQLLGDERRDDRPGIVDLVDAARDVAHRLARRGSGAGKGKPGSALPIDLGATARLDAVTNTLTTWARHVAEERAGTVWVSMPGEPAAQAAAWLAVHCEWLRHRAEVDAFIRDVRDCHAVLLSVARGPGERKYLGPCGALLLTPEPWEPGTPATTECDGDVYGRPDAATGRCRTCGTEHEQEPRLRKMTALVDGKGFRASVIAHAYGISVDTIRGWAFERRDGRGELLREPKLKAVGSDGQGRPLYLVADVLALHEQAEQRRRQRAAQAELA